MVDYRVTKYDPKHRNELGHYLLDEWTEFSDVGESVTLEDYERFESAYISAAEDIARSWDSSTFTISGLEDYHNNTELKDGQRIPLADLSSVLRSLLRCEFWCRFEAPAGFIHVGSDFYMYIGSLGIDEESIDRIRRRGLFIEKMTSPYHPEEC